MINTLANLGAGIALAMLTSSISASAQIAQTPAATDSASVPRMFRSETPLAITLTANLQRLRDDRDESSPWRSASIGYSGTDGKHITVPLRVKTHGIWRLKHCDFPPLRFNLSNKDTKQSLFHDLQKPKVVSACKNSDRYEQLVLQEMQLYRVYQVLTPASHRVRTLRISYVDSASGKTEATRYAFLFEDPDELADRLGGKQLKLKGAGPGDIDGNTAATVYLFEYLIGNTDFSFYGLHNGELISRPDAGPAIPVAYDFDFSGAVNAPYATSDPKLNIRGVRQRVYRGSCATKNEVLQALPYFRENQRKIAALYRDELGKLIEAGTIRETLSYFDEFFDSIKTARDAEENLLSKCLGKQ